MLFNEDIKKEFINRYEDKETLRVLTSFFSQIALTEYKMNKDISEMSFEELKMAIKELKYTSMSSLIDRISKLERYINYVGAKENHAEKLNDRNIILTLLNTDISNGDAIFGEEDIEFIIGELLNEQDKALIYFLYELGGKKNAYNAVINLKISDIDFENKILTIHDKDYGELKYKINQKLAKLLKDAYNQEEYVSYVNSSNGDGYYRRIPIESGECIFRGGRGATQYKPITIATKVLNVSNATGFPYLNINNIQKSGQLFMLHKLLSQGESDINYAAEKVLFHYRESFKEAACRRLVHTYNEQLEVIKRKAE